MAERCRWTRRIFPAIAASALLGGGCSNPASLGESEAVRDIAAGTLRIKTYGLPSPSMIDYDSLLKKRIGVDLKPVAGCLVDDALKQNVEGYNRKMVEEIDRRFGPGILESLQAEAMNASNPPGS